MLARLYEGATGGGPRSGATRAHRRQGPELFCETLDPDRISLRSDHRMSDDEAASQSTHEQRQVAVVALHNVPRRHAPFSGGDRAQR